MKIKTDNDEQRSKSNAPVKETKTEALQFLFVLASLHSTQLRHGIIPAVLLRGGFS